MNFGMKQNRRTMLSMAQKGFIPRIKGCEEHREKS
jgi:hypothetical protein